MEIIDREVRFDIWCQRCKHYQTPEEKEPCDECLEYPYNTQSSKPVKWEDKDS